MLDNYVEVRKRLVSEFEKVRAEIIALHIAKGMRASGAFEESLEVEGEPKSVTLWGAPHSDQLEFGRRAGGMPPLQALYDWIIAKRVMDASEKEYKIRGLAFVIARKIAREGWDRKEHGGVALISEVLTDQRIKDIINLVGKDLIPTFEAELITLFKTKN